MNALWPTATPAHLPIHASWLHQVEIYFSVLQRNAVSPADFARPRRPRRQHPGLQNRYHQAATPFDWTYDRRDVRALLDRIGPTEQTTRLTTAI